MQTSDFDKLMKRYLKGQVSGEERKKIEAWLEVMKHEDNRDLELSPEAEEKIFHQLTSKIEQEKSTTKPMAPIHQTRWPLKIAASILVLAIASFGVWSLIKDQVQSQNQAAVEKVILDDGSLVWLMNDSEISYREQSSDGMRLGNLKGNALFEITKDPKHPFIVDCGIVNLKVLGTSFSVQQYGDSVELIVLTGKVQMFSDSDSLGIFVEQNELAVFSTDKGMKKRTVSPNEAKIVTQGTEYNMEFKNTSLIDVMKKVDAKFSVITMFEEDGAGNCKITADFTDQSLSSTLTMLSEVLGVQFDVEGKQIKVTGKCQ